MQKVTPSPKTFELATMESTRSPTTTPGVETRPKSLVTADIVVLVGYFLLVLAVGLWVRLLSTFEWI